MADVMASLSGLYGSAWQPGTRKPSRTSGGDMLQYGTLIVPVPELAADGSCPIMYPECPPGDQQCVRTGAHPGPDAGHYNRAGFSWTIQEAAESAERIRHSASRQGGA